jgi:hypothetical protein
VEITCIPSKVKSLSQLVHHSGPALLLHLREVKKLSNTLFL